MAPYAYPRSPGQIGRNDEHPVVEPQYIDTERWSVHGTWREKIWFLDWLIRPWVYIMHPYIMGIWVMYTGFLVGGVCFVIGSFATITPSVYQSSPQNTYEYYMDGYGYSTGVLMKDGMNNEFDWLVLFTYELGSVAWVISMFGGIWEATNDDYHHRVREWEKGGRKGGRPWFRWIWISPLNGRFYGAWIYMTGCVAYLVSASALVWQTKKDSPFLTLWQYYNLVNRMYLLGGVTFFCAAPFYIYSWIDWTIVGGILPIPGRTQFFQAKWWAWLIFFWSGAAFFSGGVCLMFMYASVPLADPTKFTGIFTWADYRWITGWCFGVGALGYTFGSFFALAWTSELALSYEAELKDRKEHAPAAGEFSSIATP